MANAHKDYETLIIIKADLTEAEIESEVETLTKLIEADGGSVSEVNPWGKKRLAYAIRKQRYGFYSLIRFTAGPQIVANLYKHYRFNENFLKGLVVIFDGSAGRKSPSDEEDEQSKPAEAVAAAPAEPVAVAEKPEAETPATVAAPAEPAAVAEKPEAETPATVAEKPEAEEAVDNGKPE